MCETYSSESLRKTNDYISPLSQHTIYLLHIKRFGQIEQRQVKKQLNNEANTYAIKEVKYCVYSFTFLHKGAKYSFSYCKKVLTFLSFLPNDNYFKIT